MYAITGGDGKKIGSAVNYFFLILFISSEYCVTKTSLMGCFVLTFLLRAFILSLNGMFLMWLIIWLCLYPLCLSLCISTTCFAYIYYRYVGSWLVNVSVSENSTTAHARMRPT